MLIKKVKRILLLSGVAIIFLIEYNIIKILFPKKCEVVDSYQIFQDVDSSIGRRNSEKIKAITQCTDTKLIPSIKQRGSFIVLYNYIRAEMEYRCHESVTYTTHADYTFVDNLVTVAERWKGPISLALYSSGKDFQTTLNSIFYLQECTTPLVRKYVTFHIYFLAAHIPTTIPMQNNISIEKYKCELGAPYVNISAAEMHRNEMKLEYPINVGRNIARESAQTYYIFPSDIELYPSPELITKFLNMIAENSTPLLESKPKVYPLAVFEIAIGHEIPNSKSELQKMINNRTAFPFHTHVCEICHNLPKLDEWIRANQTHNLHVFHIAKRTGNFSHWEPFYIGTQVDPLYDERLTKEGTSNKMTQGYALCALDYDFLILDNAFLIHKPGIKVYKINPIRQIFISAINKFIAQVILPELRILYGLKAECKI